MSQIGRVLTDPELLRLDLGIDEFEYTEEMNNKLVALPIYPGLLKEEIENVVKGIKSIL